MTRAERDDMAELTRMPAFRRFMLRWAQQTILATGKGADSRSLEYREGGRAIVLGQLLEATSPSPLADKNPDGALAATLIQILAEADQTARKEIARGGSRDLDDDERSGPSGDD